MTHEERRRNDDQRLDEISENVREIRTMLQSVCLEVREVKTKNESCQKELTEYKGDHAKTHSEIKDSGFRIFDAVIGAAVFLIGLFEWTSRK